MLLELDSYNAFDTLHRDEFLEMAKTDMPTYYAFLWQCYRNSSILSYSNNAIDSAPGVQQGNPLGLFHFCSTMNR